MKKLLLFLLSSVLLMGLMTTPTETNAQTPVLMPLVAGDTVVNGASVTKAFKLTAGYSIIGVQFVLTKISGTVGGTTTLQVSHNGTNWFTAPGITAHTNTDVTTNTLGWSVTGAPWLWYRINSTGTGTMSAQLRVYYLARKYSTEGK